MTWSFSLGPVAAVTCSAAGSAESGAADAIRRPALSGACGVDVMFLTTSAAVSVRISMRRHLSLLVLPHCFPPTECTVSQTSAGRTSAGRGEPARRRLPDGLGLGGDGLGGGHRRGLG